MPCVALTKDSTNPSRTPAVACSAAFGSPAGIARAILLTGLIFQLSVASAQQQPQPVADTRLEYALEDPPAAAASWRQMKIDAIQRQIPSESENTARRELQAQLKWLKQWTPGSMLEQAIVQRDSDTNPELVQEPILAEYQPPEHRSEITSGDAWLERAARAQEKLHALDEPSVRKENLLATDAQAEALLGLIAEAPQPLPRQLTTDLLDWLRLHTLYRQGRAIAYRELQDVIARQPIEDFAAHDKRLRDVYRRLRADGNPGDAEFVLLDVRMLRRDEQFGRALQRLEKYRWAIDTKWYLKKRRDLLQELDWQPPYEEAAKVYAAYQDQ